jgi:hypothetical protein
VKRHADHHDVTHAIACIDDAVVRAERMACATDVVQAVGDLSLVVGVDVGEHQHGAGGRRSGVVTVHPLDLR